METQNKQKTLKDKIMYNLIPKVFEAIAWVGAFSFSFMPAYMGTRAGLEQGYSQDFIEKQWKVESQKERNPYCAKVAEFIQRPGRKLAYLTTDQYKFPWRGYKRHINP